MMADAEYMAGDEPAACRVQHGHCAIACELPARLSTVTGQKWESVNAALASTGAKCMS